MTEASPAQVDEKVEINGAGNVSNPDGPAPEWKASKEVLLVLLCLSIICMMASLDMTIFLPVLPVSA